MIDILFLVQKNNPHVCRPVVTVKQCGVKIENTMMGSIVLLDESVIGDLVVFPFAIGQLVYIVLRFDGRGVLELAVVDPGAPSRGGNFEMTARVIAEECEFPVLIGIGVDPYRPV